MNSPGTQVNELREKNERAETVWLGEKDLKNDGKLIRWFTWDEVSLVIDSIEFGTHLAQLFQCAFGELVLVENYRFIRC